MCTRVSINLPRTMEVCTLVSAGTVGFVRCVDMRGCRACCLRRQAATDGDGEALRLPNANPLRKHRFSHRVQAVYKNFWMRTFATRCSASSRAIPTLASEKNGSTSTYNRRKEQQVCGRSHTHGADNNTFVGPRVAIRVDNTPPVANKWQEEAGSLVVEKSPHLCARQEISK